MAYVIGAGTLVQVEISSTMTSIPQVVSCTPPELTMGTVETTHLTSTGREFMPTIPDGGEVSFELEYDPANSVHNSLYDFYTGKTVVPWRIRLADTGNLDVTFNGFITKFGVGELSVDAVVRIPVTIRTTGMPVYTP